MKTERIYNLYTIIFVIGLQLLISACSSTYEATPVPFRDPSSYVHNTTVAETVIAAEAYVDPAKAKQVFGFDVRGVGLLPVQIIFDNQGSKTFEIIPNQCFLIEPNGNIWQILTGTIAFDRVTKNTVEKQALSDGARKGAVGAVFGSIIGGAIGVVTGENALESAGKGAVVGAAAGSTLGGAQAFDSEEAKQKAFDDFKDKCLENKKIEQGNLTRGFLFFPGEATGAKQLKLKIKETTGVIHNVNIDL